MKLSVLDCEMTGLNPYKHEVIEVASKLYSCSGITSDSFRENITVNTKIKPKHIELAESKALEINGYSEQNWKDALEPEESLQILEPLIEKSDLLLGQNLYNDLVFLEEAYRKIGKKIVFPPYIDTKHMAQNLKDTGMILNTNLDYLCQHFNINFSGQAHSALADVERTFNLFLVLKELTPITYFNIDKPFNPYKVERRVS